MAEASKRVLHRGPLRTPTHSATQTSYTEPTNPPGDILIQKGAGSQSIKGNNRVAVEVFLCWDIWTDVGTKVIKFSSEKTPQPFMNPAIMNAKVVRERIRMTAEELRQEAEQS